MSWWDSASFSHFASNALKTAQQRIDKVLDIKDEDEETGGTLGGKAAALPNKPSSVATTAVNSGDGSFWASYLGQSDALTGFTSTPSKSKSVSKPTARAPAVTFASSEFSLSVSGSERSELKTSVTSAFTVHSKRVESSLTEYQLAATKVDAEQVVPEARTDSTKGTTTDLEVTAEKAVATSTGTKTALTAKNEPQLETAKVDDRGCSPSSTPECKASGENWKGELLRLGSKKPKVNDEVAEKSSKAEEAKREEAAISAQFEQLLSVEVPAVSGDELSQTQKMEARSTDGEGAAILEVSGTDSKLTEWSLGLEVASDLVQLGEGSGWEAEDLDVDDISDDREESGSQVESPSEPSGALSEEVVVSTDITTAVTEEMTPHVIVTEESTMKSQEELSTVTQQSDPLEASGPENLTEQSKMEECSQSVEVIDVSELYPSEMEVSVQEHIGNQEGVESSSAGDAESETESTKVANSGTTEVEPTVADSGTTEVEPKSVTEEVDGADVQVSEVSFDSSDATDAAGDDQLSESSRTLTGDDFHSLQEETEQQPDGESATTLPAPEEPHTQASRVSKEAKKAGPLVSSSYVKTMLEEAMTESVKDTDSHSSSTSDKSSEMVRIESGMNSGHTSGDEIDTTTSSDIEIISTPTPNGEYRQERPFDMSPLRHALSRTMRRGSPPSHKRSDSSSSGQSTWSKNGDDLLSPDGCAHRDPESAHDAKRDDHHKGYTARGQHRLKQTDEEESASYNPLETQTLLKKLAEMAEVLEVREKKLVELSRENIDLQEAKAILKNQLQQSEEAREAELEDLNTVNKEFTSRISDFEEKVRILARERDALKKQLNETQTELSKKVNASSSMERLLQEKDQQVAELLDEGEKLSKQQLTSNNIIKKLRVKEKDYDALIKTHKQKMEQQSEELSHLRMVLDAKEDLEKRQIEAIGQQNAAVKKQEEDILMLRGELEDMQEKARGLQAALDNSYKEISELHKANAGAASETARAKLSVEMSAKHELQVAMERQTLTHKQQIDSLLAQIEDLQLSMVRQEREQGRREDVLRQEISDVQQRLQEAEERNQDLTQIVTSATRPLLRQIKNLQSTYDAQSGSYEKVETNLTQRLNEAQKSLAEALEKERAASEQLLEVTSRLSSVETHVSTLRQEKSHLQAQMEVEKTKVMVLEDAKNTASANLEVLKTKFTNEISELKKEKVMLENQWEMEKMRVESERKKVALAHEQLMDKELQLQRQGMTPSPRSATPRSTVVSNEELVTGEASPMTASITQEDILEKTLLLGSANGSKSNLYETLRHTGAATLLENLQSQLKMKEGEIVQLQNEIAELERTREAMARELVNLATANDVLQEQLAEYPELKKAHGELDSRYNALLQMYGEKVEEADELSMDLQDVKDMYKAQIEELVKRVR